MSGRLCACLLNVSEAHNKALVEKIALAALRINEGKKTKSINTASEGPLKSAVLNIFSDLDYNRSVITIVSLADFVVQSVSNACVEAMKVIDLTQHKGGHPRLGAVDLVPIHPISGDISLHECGDFAKEIASAVKKEIPDSSFFYYGFADKQRRSLVQRRKEVKWFGKRELSSDSSDSGISSGGKLGLTGIGASPYVMNCNVTIDTEDVQFGAQIAASLRGANPEGLIGVEAMAFAHEGKVEIACNVNALFEEDNNLTKEQKEMMTCSFDSYYNIRPDVIEERVVQMARMRNIKTVGTSLVGFSPEEAHRLAKHVLSCGPAEFWRERQTRQM